MSHSHHAALVRNEVSTCWFFQSHGCIDVTFPQLWRDYAHRCCWWSSADGEVFGAIQLRVASRLNEVVHLPMEFTIAISPATLMDIIVVAPPFPSAVEYHEFGEYRIPKKVCARLCLRILVNAASSIGMEPRQAQHPETISHFFAERRAARIMNKL